MRSPDISGRDAPLRWEGEGRGGRSLPREQRCGQGVAHPLPAPGWPGPGRSGSGQRAGQRCPRLGFAAGRARDCRSCAGSRSKATYAPAPASRPACGHSLSSRWWVLRPGLPWWTQGRCFLPSQHRRAAGQSSQRSRCHAGRGRPWEVFGGV